MEHNDIALARTAFKVADLAVKQARNRRRQTPSDDTAKALKSAVADWEAALEAWGDVINKHDDNKGRLEWQTASSFRIKGGV